MEGSFEKYLERLEDPKVSWRLTAGLWLPGWLLTSSGGVFRRRWDRWRSKRCLSCTGESCSGDWSRFSLEDWLLKAKLTLLLFCLSAKLAVVCVCRRSFHIYRYPGKPATVISEDDFVDKVLQRGLAVAVGAAA